MNQDNNSDKKSQRAQIISRFGCGFIFGIVLAFAGGLVTAPQTTTGLIILVILCATLGGILSVILGESFWVKFWKWFL